MSKGRFPKLKSGVRLSTNATILGMVDRNIGRHPVYIVWRHDAWCPAACKLFDSAGRARQEFDVLMRCAHPNIVRAWGAGDTPPHLLVEFLEGKSIGRLIDQFGRLPLAATLRLAIHIGGALNYMHAQGFVHLDVKPENVIIARERPVLFDFGCARAIGGDRPDIVQGTDPNIAPEECRLESVAEPADVFSFGVMIYEMLTGALPFPEPTRATPFPQLTAIPVAAVSRRPRLPLRLSELLLQCLAQDPAVRPKLPALLTEFNAMIGSGAPMWPAGFSPLGAKARAPRAS